jgi:hypothetical protein
MVDSVKNYGLAGVGANVQLGKGGVSIVGSNSDQISFVNTSDAAVNINIADGTASSHAVTKSQMDAITDPKLQYSETSVNYNSGTVSIGTTNSNTFIHAVIVEKGAGNWTSANATTEITVGDGSDNDRLFAGFDPTVQCKFEPKHKYTSATALNAYVTQGGASAGSATVRIWYSGEIA